MNADAEVGYFGKLPQYGDFVKKRLPGDCLNRFDQWFREGIHIGRETYGDKWLDKYLQCPAWRFFVSAGVLSGPSWAGVWIPSVDRVGRYFPFLLAQPDPVGQKSENGFQRLNAWLEELENLAFDALDEVVDLPKLETALQTRRHSNIEVTANTNVFRERHVEFELAGADVEHALANLLMIVLSQDKQRCSLWWTHGNENSKARLYFFEGWPAAEDLTRFI